MAFTAQSIAADHKDLVHDVSYDFYGRRFATCSSDQFVKVWDLSDEDEWYCSSSFKAHSGSVWKVTWAHPEFGQILATCSFDRTVAVWEEKLDAGVTSTKDGSPSNSKSSSESKGSSSWVRRALLVDSRTSITDVKFAPRHLGLLLATCSLDGTLRIYEAPDIMNLSQWNPQHDLNCKMSLSCLSWNPSPFHSPMIAVGSDEPSSVQRFQENNCQPTPPSLTASFFGRNQSRNTSSAIVGALPVSSVKSSSVTIGRIQIYESSENTRRWVKVEVINLVTDPVYDLSFASSVGKDCHLLAVGSTDVRILAIKESNRDREMLHTREDSMAGIMTPSSFMNTSSYHNLHNSHSLLESTNCPKYDVSVQFQSDDHRCKVWRLSWNMTGTILASSGEDANIRLWKSNYLDSWRSIGIIRMDGSSTGE